MYTRIVLLTISIFFVTACGIKNAGNSSTGFKLFDDVKIQPEQAAKLAEPYLELSSKIKRKNSDIDRSKFGESKVVVSQKGRYYYVVKENYPAKSISFYVKYAVKVHVDTGVVSPPNNGT
ncbi:hypothetical protein [Pseudoalteromonas obscura]|uniref:Lipoprotein n=1 Tax=Pseudoalteromonas obscura TaxID=3048491 RepID=A0ABT7EJP0_9GAMM|nr:hypothetical protein [Pseudoalteromonas sp. P94(2023)]MDK2595267.1 hypothetical protein [Pseudoalteromonas sp. P94(2023)]